MNKTELNNKVDERINATKEALQIVYNALNNGQQKQIIKDEKVKKLFDFYGVEYTE